MLLYWLLTEADCSGRALATLVVAWVGAALVASVLLKWTHMWVALAVLTLLFLAACGYAACDARRTHERALAREEERQLERRRRREQHLQSVSSGIDNFPEIIDPPEYETYWVSDLPPSYSSAVSTQTGNATETTAPGIPEIEEVPISPPRLSNPPPYAIAIQSEPLFLPIHNNNQTGSTGSGGTEVPQMPLQTQNGQTVILQSPEIGQTSSHSGNSNVRLPQIHSPLSSAVGSEDKVEERPENANVAVAPTRTQYLTSIINSTFGRATMRRTNTLEQQNAIPMSAANNRNRDQSLVNNSITNNDRNINNNNLVGPPPHNQYPARLSGDFSNC